MIWYEQLCMKWSYGKIILLFVTFWWVICIAIFLHKYSSMQVIMGGFQLPVASQSSEMTTNANMFYVSLNKFSMAKFNFRYNLFICLLYSTILMVSHKTVKSIRGLIQYKYAFLPIKNFHCRDNMTWDCVIFIMRIPILVTQYLYII